MVSNLKEFLVRGEDRYWITRRECNEWYKFQLLRWVEVIVLKTEVVGGKKNVQNERMGGDSEIFADVGWINRLKDSVRGLK